MADSHSGVQGRGRDEQWRRRSCAVCPDMRGGAVSLMLCCDLQWALVREVPSRGDEETSLKLGRVGTSGIDADVWHVCWRLVQPTDGGDQIVTPALFLRRWRCKGRAWRLCSPLLQRRWWPWRWRRGRSLGGVDRPVHTAWWKIPGGRDLRCGLERQFEGASQRGRGAPRLQVANADLERMRDQIDAVLWRRARKMGKHPHTARVPHPQLRRELRTELCVRQRGVTREKHAREDVSVLVGEDVAVGEGLVELQAERVAGVMDDAAVGRLR
jgi:hypothetical protein